MSKYIRKTNKQMIKEVREALVEYEKYKRFKDEDMPNGKVGFNSAYYTLGWIEATVHEYEGK